MGNDTPLGFPTRRDFVRTAIASAGLLAAGGVRVLGAPRPPPPGTRNPLNIPPIVSPSNFDLSAAPATVPLGGGQYSSALAYNTLFPGPTFLASTGNTADRKSTRLNSSHVEISYAVFCLKKKKKKIRYIRLIEKKKYEKKN